MLLQFRGRWLTIWGDPPPPQLNPLQPRPPWNESGFDAGWWNNLCRVEVNVSSPSMSCSHIKPHKSDIVQGSTVIYFLQLNPPHNRNWNRWLSWFLQIFTWPNNPSTAPSKHSIQTVLCYQAPLVSQSMYKNSSYNRFWNNTQEKLVHTCEYTMCTTHKPISIKQVSMPRNTAMHWKYPDCDIFHCFSRW